MQNIQFEIKDVDLTYLDKDIFSIHRLAVHFMDRIGIVGPNGSGKTSLIRLLAGELEPSKGEIHRHASFAYLKQMEVPEDAEVDPKVLGKLQVPDLEEGISGGEQTKIKIAQLLANYQEALLIDEPTTHLDQQGIRYLRRELENYYGTLILISHDRKLLDQLVTTIWEIRDGEIHIYSGNYTDYEEQKALEESQQQEAHEQYLKEKSRLEAAAQDKMQKAAKMTKGAKANARKKEGADRRLATKPKDVSQKGMQKSAKAIERRMEQLEKVDAVQHERPIQFHRSKALELHHSFPVMGNQLTLKAGEKLLLEAARFQFPLGKKIAITGANGSGKSTLLQAIYKRKEGLEISPKVEFGFFEQLAYQEKSDETVLASLRKTTDYEEGFLRSVLHSMYFRGNDIYKKLRYLSGGEAIRLQLCRLFLGSYHILLLDEPTNFLDIQTTKALESFFKGYPGTIIFVSHDAAFIENVADHVYEMKNNQIIEK
ncbi:ribosomal protection-like ABC-F family protein [Oceanobacillus timonensis]|uniref:ribosomal protection-like ABC-F family protein n=1 Tax=Oceanobacillus timonensis TaxID=1926285 RepID=UPI0009BB9ECA|nr:ABC-F type ribosomal protection protein [Oceanobacillus timonensis]